MVAFELSVAHLLNVVMLNKLSNEVLCTLFVGRGQRCICIPVCALVAASYQPLSLAARLSNTLLFFKRILAIP
jgi:hypothetical protein